MENPESVFVKIFGATPLVKVLDFLLTYEGFDYSKSQIAKETGVARMTIDLIWERLIKSCMITKTRKIGQAEMYKLNKKNPIIEALIDFNLKISGMAARENAISIKHRN